ncbi:MAG TPA: hypothetical protein VHD56_01515 [Tepidisphaeraceae bacterium]|nr:hypothetical protein [Tepidisphaeraceae bacterium]
MQWEIEGADKFTAKEIVVKVEAFSKEDAIEYAFNRGIFVASCKPIKIDLPKPFVKEVAKSVQRKSIIVISLVILVTVFVSLHAYYLYEQKRFSISPTSIKRKSFYDIDFKIMVRSESGGDLYPLPNSVVYVIPISKQLHVENLLDEYKSNIVGKLDALAKSTSKLVALRLKKQELEDQISQLTSDLNHVQPQATVDSLLGNTESIANSKVRQDYSALIAIKNTKPEIETIEKSLQTDCENYFQQMATTYKIQVSKLKQALSLHSEFTFAVSSLGEYKLSGLETGEYVVCVLPQEQMWYWYVPVKVNGNMPLFLGPDQRTFISQESDDSLLNSKR